jgi:hypothetical protein
MPNISLVFKAKMILELKYAIYFISSWSTPPSCCIVCNVNFWGQAVHVSS